MTPTEDRGGVGLSMADWEKESRRWLADMRKAPQPDHMADMCDFYIGKIVEMQRALDAAALRGAPAAGGPLPLVMWCPQCGLQHIDRGEWETRLHRTHRCDGCGTEWRPAKIYTVGVVQLAPVPEAPATPPAAPGPGR